MNKDEEIVCRFCRCPAEENDPLFHPCKCAGSIKYIHESCLEEWLKRCKKESCELCGHPYSFEAIYQENAPNSLGFFELLYGCSSLVKERLVLTIKTAIVLLIYVYIVPFLAQMYWKDLFGFFYAEDYAFVLENLTPNFEDVLIGWFMICVVVVLFCISQMLQEYLLSNSFLHLYNGQGDVLQNETEVGANVDLDQEYEAENEGLMPELAHQNLNDDDDEDIIRDDLVEYPPQTAQEHLARALAGDRASRQEAAPVDIGPDENPEQQATRLLEDFMNPPEDLNDNEHENAEEEDNENEEEDPLLDFSDFSELFLTSSIRKTVARAAILLNLFCLVFTFFGFGPYAIGDVLWRIVAFLFAVPPRITSILFVHEISIFTLGLICSCGLFLGSIRVLRPYVHGRASLRQLLDLAAMVYLFVKLCGVLFLELFVFPIYCGVLLDYFTCEYFNSTAQHRLDFHYNTPMISTLLHWLAGIVYLFHFSALVSLLRTFLRPYVLRFLRNPDDPAFNPIRDIVEKTFFQQARRFFVSFLMYSALIYTFVRLPLGACLHYFPILPLAVSIDSFATTFVEVILMFVLVVFLPLKPLNLRRVALVILKEWSVHLARALDLEEYLIADGGEGPSRPYVPYRGSKLGLFVRLSLWIFVSCVVFAVTVCFGVAASVLYGRWLVHFVAGPYAPVNDCYTFLVGCAAAIGSAQGLFLTTRFFVNHWRFPRAIPGAVFDVAVSIGVSLVLLPILLGTLSYHLLALGLPATQCLNTMLLQSWLFGMVVYGFFVRARPFAHALYHGDTALTAAAFPDYALQHCPDALLLPTVIGLKGLLLAERGMILPHIRAVIVPLLTLTSTHTLIHWLVHALGLSMNFAAIVSLRFIYPVALFSMVFPTALTLLRRLLAQVYQAVFDLKYLRGRRLLNLNLGDNTLQSQMMQ